MASTHSSTARRLVELRIASMADRILSARALRKRREAEEKPASVAVV